ncbi:phage tail tape measure protein [Flavobacterium psychrotrophum]|uniref:phage tail tape measure protein n=1 Tax=Flavobacterium psychrotrophum TaxID=2294119 RepID=UPI000E317C87|nr:phage tail tape measure protein [Flavobacterium psychrotrophum]
MGRQLSDDTIRLNIIINGNQAQKEILDLDKSNIRLKDTIKDQLAQQKELKRQRKTNTEEYRSLTAAINENKNAIAANNEKIRELTSDLKLSELTMAQLRSKATLLQATLRHLVPGTEDFEKYNAELTAVNERMGELRGNGQQASWSLGSMADRFNRYGGIIASFVAAVAGVVVSIQKVLSANKELADSITNVQKTTGMTKTEVEELAKSFGMLKTRTGRIDLLGIAEIGGRLGIAKSEIADFVRVMDKSAVALGDSFEGGADVVAEKLGRIKGLYKELKDERVETAFESVGSALNDLGADGTASEQNLAEFAQRVGTLPEVLRPSIQTVLGMGAAFEESGLKAELAGNNYGKVISIAARDYPAFAKVMRRSANEVKNLINTNPNEFFLQFSQSLKGLDATELAKVLDYLKLNDNEVKMVLGAASQNVQMFRDKIKLANESMSDATSLTEEYNLKNENLAATLDRIKKRVMGWFTADSFVAFLESAVNWLARFIGAVEDDTGTMAVFKNVIVLTAKILAIFTAAIATNLGWIKLSAVWANRNTEATLLYNIALKTRAIIEAATVIGTRAMVLVQNLLTLNIKGTVQAYKALTAAMKTTPWGLVLSLVAAAAAAYVAYAERVQKLTEEQKAFNSIHVNVLHGLKDEKQKISDLLSVAKDEKVAKETRLKAIKDLIAISPEYLNGLSLETINTEATTKAIDAYISALDRKLEAEEIENEISASKSRIREIEKKEVQEYKRWYDGMFDPDAELAQNKKAAGRRLDAIKSETDLQKKLYERRKQLYIETNGQINPDDNTTKAFVPGDGKDISSKLRAERLKQLDKDREENKKYQQEVLDLQRRAIDDRLALLQDGFEKEEAIEAENHKRKLEDLKKQLVDEAQIALLDEKINNTKATPLERGVASETKRIWLERNKHLNELIEIEHGRHRFAMETIDLKAETKSIADLQQKFDRESTLRQAKHNEELAALGTNEIAKQKLQDAFDKAELERQTAHLEKLLKFKEDILADKNNQIDLDLLTPEQKQQIEDDVANLKLKLSELMKAKGDLQNRNGSNDFQTAAKNVFGDADVLGFTADQWGKTFTNIETLEQKMAAVKMVIGALQSAWSAYADYQTASENASVANFQKNSDNKKRRLKSQLDNGYINQMQYKRGIETLDADLEKKQAEVAYKQAKRQKLMNAANVIMNTSQAIMGIWAQFPKFDFGATAAVMSGVVGALGALQLATIMKTPLPAKGYEKGLYPEYVKREQDGKTFRAGYGGKTRSGMVSKPTYFLAGENGPEMVIDAAAYRQMSPDTKAMLIRELRGIKGFEKGMYNKDVTGGRYEVPAASSAPGASSLTLDQALAIINRNSDILEKLHNDGVTAYMSRDGRELKKLREEMDRITQSKLKAQS